ncbi:MAG: bifunctional adenosylcobinamide kinase/adenosylcobinamide-phosphate guanylyltransferase [Actinomycetota bacterium]|nr:bifunctional adenosylcobinamide kinase/adenosylcobinamide-phosphate guanylyltransferase [Actinomycetota bacterium]
MAVTLVTGGARSGKSRHAEQLLLHGGPAVYVATGRPPDGGDAEWSARVQRHRDRRPPTWQTLETLDLADVVLGADRPLLIDCLGTWLAGLVDHAGAWADLDRAGQLVDDATTSLVHALRHTQVDVVIVTNEVGMSVVPATPSGRFFQDELGIVNAAVAAVADRVHLVVAGRVLDLSTAPVVP